MSNIDSFTNSVKVINFGVVPLTIFLIGNAQKISSKNMGDRNEIRLQKYFGPMLSHLHKARCCLCLLADLFGQKTVVLRVIFSCLSLPAAHCIFFSNQFHCCKSSFGYSTQFIWEPFLISFSVMSINEIRHRRK